MTEPKLPTLDELAELAGLHEAATPGPWHHDGHAFVSCGGPHASGSTLVDCSKHVDADYIAAARNAIPGLLAAARRGMEADDTIRRIGLLLAGNGCDCECDHHAEEHEDDCSRCLACLVELTIKTGVGFLGLGNKGDGK